MLDKLSNGVFFIKRLVKFIVNVKYKPVLTNKIILFVTWKNYVFWREKLRFDEKSYVFDHFCDMLYPDILVIILLKNCYNVLIFSCQTWHNNFYLRLWRLMLGKGKRFCWNFLFCADFYKSYEFFPRSIFYSREWRKLNCVS